jgi:hypothetical protein
LRNKGRNQERADTPGCPYSQALPSDSETAAK